ncbi:MAG: hypothetical protein B6D46_12855 [Polyangiaceae bacterium UTPRO1]|jgi:hypothetical protein|nr:hypothetical protein [Myxococcales bacterium]OQY65585.1 MAG: hypothetical protein B6D46_12855 [Polyangiaceae bacterium UTPRO1]
MRIAAGRLFALFSYDVAYEIDLGRLRTTSPAAAANDGRRNHAPPRVQYPSPAATLALRSRPVALAGRRIEAEVTLRAHEFGAVTIVLALPFDGVDCTALPALMAHLTTDDTLAGAARAALDDALAQLAPAVTRPAAGSYMVEDYYVIQVSRFDPGVDAPALLGTHRDLLARIVHCEPQPLSPSEGDEVLRTAVTYHPHDLVVTDWNVALVFDEEWEDALDVLELLNVQLLELRFLDAMLDHRIGELYEHLSRPHRFFSFRREVVRVRELAELRLDTATLRERLVNAVKLVGDLYLTKIYARTAERLHLGEWQRSIDGKLELVQKIADVLSSRAATARAEILEVTIILLIALEIVLFFVR